MLREFRGVTRDSRCTSRVTSVTKSVTVRRESRLPVPTRPDPSHFFISGLCSDSPLCPSSALVKFSIFTPVCNARERLAQPSEVFGLMDDKETAGGLASSTCPMTGEPHVWGDWERVVEQMWGGEPGDRIPTGDRARECKVCGRWQVEWAE